jgi:L-fucose mutarotase/ribose pyranase (RbsD/FucU family)
MRRLTILTALLFALTIPALAQSDWHAAVDQRLPLLGHRNWIVIADSAYPQSSSPGVEIIETDADQLEVVKYVLGAVNKSIHVRPDVLMDAELQYVPEADAPGVTAYRQAIDDILADGPVHHELHGTLLQQLDEASKMYRVVVLKTRMAVPYTTIFLRLNCKYWSDDAEKRLRDRMAAAAPGRRTVR